MIHLTQSNLTQKQFDKFEKTIEEGYWQKDVETQTPQTEDTVISATEWTREFDAKKKPKQILKSTKNLVERAAEYADILDLKAEITIDNNQPEPFAYKADKPSDYFKIKSWK